MVLAAEKKKSREGLLGGFPVVVVLVFFVTSSFFHDFSLAADFPQALSRPRIGLVLSGGGARGAAHIGVIRALEEMRIPIDIVTGTSMGSIVGGLYASGMSCGELEKTVTDIDWVEAFKDTIPRKDRSFRRKQDDKTYLIQSKSGLSNDLELKLPSGLIQGQKIDLILKRLTLPVSSVKDFDNFRIPFRAVATDIATGEPVILDSGDLAMAMRASMSIPAAFAAVEKDGKLLVDGGVSNNLPIDVARQMGADIIIAVDISTPLLNREKLNSSLRITQQLTGILTRRSTEAQIATLTEKDFLIVPDLGNISTAAFERAYETIPIGYQAAEKIKKELLHLSLSQSEFEAYLAASKRKPDKRESEPPVIDFVNLDNRSRISDKMVLVRLDIEVGQPLDLEKLEKNIGKIYGLELFESIVYEVVEENGRTGIVLHVRERSWGPNYIQGGLSLTGNQEGDSTYSIGIAYSRTAMNKLGGEFRLGVQVGNEPAIFSEIYQPLDYDSRYYIHPRVFWIKDNVNLYSPTGNIVAEYNVYKYGLDLAGGRELGTWGESRIGIRRMRGNAEVETGLVALPEYDYDSGELYLKLSVDKLNNRNFPRKGYSGFMEYILSLEDLGADNSFDQVLVEAMIAESWGRNNLIAGGRFNFTVDSDAPLQNRFQLGGLFNLAGYQEDELSGQHMGLLLLSYMRRINDFNLLPTYIGASLEFGNVWQDDDDIAFDNLITSGNLFVGVDSPIGPVYLGYGQAEGNINSLYFYLGKVF
jgi:NTE family protein